MPRSSTAFFLLLLLACITPVHALTLKIATAAPAGTPWMKAMKTAAAEIKTRTQGRVKLRFFPGGVMGDDRTVLRKMRIGQLHGGAFTNGGLAQVVPETNLYSIPFLFQDREEVLAARARFDDELIERLQGAGLTVFRFSDGGFAYMMSTHPIAGTADLHGRKAWIPSGDFISQKALEALGASPVPLPLTDVLTGLQTGLIDTIAAPFAGAVALQWHTRVKYVTDLPVSYLFTALAFSQRAMKRIKPEDRAVMAEVITRLSDRFSEQTWQDEAGARQALVKQGLHFVTPPAGTAQDLRAKVLPAMEALARDGAFDPDFYQRLTTFIQQRRRNP